MWSRLDKCSFRTLTQHFQVSLSQEVLCSWVVNDAVHWNSIILFGDRESHPAGHGKHPVIRLLNCCLTWKNTTMSIKVGGKKGQKQICNCVIAIKHTLPVKAECFHYF